jgi:hypothetical protein
MSRAAAQKLLSFQVIQRSVMDPCTGLELELSALQLKRRDKSSGKLRG